MRLKGTKREVEVCLGCLKAELEEVARKTHVREVLIIPRKDWVRIWRKYFDLTIPEVEKRKDGRL